MVYCNANMEDLQAAVHFTVGLFCYLLYILFPCLLSVLHAGCSKIVFVIKKLSLLIKKLLLLIRKMFGNNGNMLIHDEKMQFSTEKQRKSQVFRR